MRDILTLEDRRRLMERFERLDPTHPALWGKMNAPSMVAHLCDQMRLTLGNQSCAPLRGPWRIPVLRELGLYVVPWPKGRIKGPPEVFATAPGEWDRELGTLGELIEEFARQEHRDAWPDHPYFGRMNRRSWAVFCHRHFDHHLRQFGG